MKYKKIHFVGIKGVGMTPLAIIAKEAGFEVSGSDVADQFITDETLSKAGIKPLVGFSPENIKGADLVIVTGAHKGLLNIEVKEAKEKGIKVLTQGEAVGVFMEGDIFNRKFSGISVAGTHGKTTTTAMIATILKECGLDPSFLIGTSSVWSLGLPGHYGAGEYFIAEADEYATDPLLDKTAKFLWQHPKIAVITNIDFDHSDVYSSLSDVISAFSKFTAELFKKEGLLVTCGDDKGVNKLLEICNGRKITYGFANRNDFIISDIKSYNGHAKFVLKNKGKLLGVFHLNIFGEQNILNAAAAILVSCSLGLNIDSIEKGILNFRGTKRRSEYIGDLPFGAKLFDDYAHHPTEIKNTLKAFRANFPNKRIVCIFQPHTYSRTKSLFDQFIRSFDYADIVILTEIYASLREKIDRSISSKDLERELKKTQKEVVFLPKLTDVVKYISKNKYKSDTVLITMGAGDVYKISQELSVWQAQDKS